MVAVDSEAAVSVETATPLVAAAPLIPLGEEPSTDVAMSSSRDVAASSLVECQYEAQDGGGGERTS